MQERKGAITFQGEPLTLLGSQVEVGRRAPNVTLTANDMSQVRLSDFLGSTTILMSVPSLDTSVW